jgi:hypothetical protein
VKSLQLGYEKCCFAKLASFFGGKIYEGLFAGGSCVAILNKFKMLSAQSFLQYGIIGAVCAGRYLRLEFFSGNLSS